jgi:hypothetical protein
MKIIFKYDENSDIDCLLDKGPGSNNQPSLQTRTYAELLKFTVDVKNIEKVREFVRKYIQEQGLDLPKKALELQEEWNKISNEFEKRAEKIFGVKVNDTISAYLTITGRFPYNLEQKLFFVSVLRNSANSIAMHELWHFYTWHKFGQEQMIKLGPQKYNDLKEALTVLLNLECADLMNGEFDKGYTQHQELRKQITEYWLKNKNISGLWEYLVNSANN